MDESDKGPMDRLSAHLDRAWDLVARGDLQGAMRSAEKSLEMDDTSPEVRNLLDERRAQSFDGYPLPGRSFTFTLRVALTGRDDAPVSTPTPAELNP